MIEARVIQDCAKGLAGVGMVEERVEQDCAKGLAPVGAVEVKVEQDCAKGLASIGVIETQTVFQAPQLQAQDARVLTPSVPARAELVLGR